MPVNQIKNSDFGSCLMVNGDEADAVEECSRARAWPCVVRAQAEGEELEDRDAHHSCVGEAEA